MKPKTLLYLVASLLFTINLVAQDGIKPIIDVHVHGYSKEEYRPRPESAAGKSPKTFEAFREETMTALKKYNVVKAVLSTRGGNHDFGDDERLIYGYHTSLPPPVEDTVEFKRRIEAGEIEVFGEVGAVYAGYTLSDPAFDPLFSDL